jgi:hypothetical protein
MRTVVRTHNALAQPININNTSLMGSIAATERQLISLFGSPIRYERGEGNSTRDWHLLFDDGTVATIYDWHTDGFAPLNPGESYNWRIGARVRSAVWNVHDIFRERSGLVARSAV